MEATACAAVRQQITVNEKDFCADFDAGRGVWTAKWNWLGGREPEEFKNRVPEYRIPEDVRQQYEAELDKWMQEGWLQQYDEEKLGAPKALIPLMAVVQENKKKVRPVLDFRELNSYIEAHTADADVCAEKLREWRRQGTKVAVLDLSSAYMQVHVAESLWPFQTVELRGRRYCLTRLGFGLNVAPLIMKAVLTSALAQDELIQKAASSFVDDIYINEEIISADAVSAHLLKFGLRCKPAERVADGARVLGLKVEQRGQSKTDARLSWSRGNEVPVKPEVITRRSVFSFCGKMVSHFPVCGWLRPAAAWIKRRANAKSEDWDSEIADEQLGMMLDEVACRVRRDDPVKGRWDVLGQEATVWADDS